MHYGDFDIADEYVADFQGWSKSPNRKYSAVVSVYFV